MRKVQASTNNFSDLSDKIRAVAERYLSPQRTEAIARDNFTKRMRTLMSDPEGAGRKANSRSKTACILLALQDLGRISQAKLCAQIDNDRSALRHWKSLEERIDYFRSRRERWNLPSTLQELFPECPLSNAA